MSQVTVRIPTPLRAFSGQKSEIEVEAQSVGEALRTVVGLHSDLGPYIFTSDGALRRFVNVYLDERDVQDLEGLDSRTAAGNVVHIVPAVAGGAPAGGAA